MSADAKRLWVLVLAALWPLSARAGEASDFEKKLLELGRDARPKQLSVSLTLEERVKGAVQTRGTGTLRYDSEEVILAATMKLSAIDGFEVKKDLIVENACWADRKGGVVSDGKTLATEPAGFLASMAGKDGEPAEGLELSTLGLLTAHGLAALNKLCRFEASKRSEAGLIWFKLVPREGVKHGFCDALRAPGALLELAVDEKTGAVRAAAGQDEVGDHEPGETVTAKMVTQFTDIRFSYEPVPKDLGAQLKLDLAKARERAAKEGAGKTPGE